MVYIYVLQNPKMCHFSKVVYLYSVIFVIVILYHE